MYIIGIHDGHNSTACLLKDGEILGMVSEERFTKIKNKGGFPFHSISWLLENFKVEADEIEKIAFAGKIMPVVEVTSKKRYRHKLISNLSKVLPSSLFRSKMISQLLIKRLSKKRENFNYYDKEFSELKLKKQSVAFFDHHQCHGATAYFSNPNFNYEDKVLVFTLDGSGDAVSATVAIGHKNKMERLKTIHSYDSLGMIYSRTTAFLGMKPLEHEYKLMGMAPYASDFLTDKSYKVFKEYISLSQDGLSVVNNTGLYGNALLEKMKKDFFLHRFDGISAGLQKRTEEVASKWIFNWIKKTGIQKIVVAGGVFMNVKLNMILNESSNVKDVFFMPSCGDESIGLGSAYLQYFKQSKNKDVKIKKFNNIYWGPEYSEKENLDILKNSDFNYKKYEDINGKVSEMIANNMIIGRCHGRMEFGARSLGNRSIIANPKNYQIVSKINRAIKMRDFWMPFAASLIKEDAEKYIKTSNKSIDAPYMILGFNTTKLAQNEIAAGLHQSDFTCRPQIVSKESNPDYYDLLLKFRELTGISGVLNTSFNIHGYPIVNGPEDALWTLSNSDLDAVQLGNYLVTKK